MLCLSTLTPGFPHFYYILGANLRSFLHGDVAVMFSLDIEMEILRLAVMSEKHGLFT